MRRIIRILLVFVVGITLLVSCHPDHKSPVLRGTTYSSQEKTGASNLAYKWSEVALKATANDTERFRPRPTITSRYLALIFVAMFDAWSRYDEYAKPVYLEGVERRALAEQTELNKEIAISYAAFRAMSHYYYSDSLMFAVFMQENNMDASITSLDPNTPEGIGNLAAKAVIESRKFDGSNEMGNEAGSDGKFYYDYSNYKPVNTIAENTDINRWQPKNFIGSDGKAFAPSCLTPYWQNVKPVALKSADQFRSPPPPLVGSAQLEKEVKEVVDLQANITNEQRALVEFMRDGPASVQQAGHWLKFAQQVSVRDNHTLDEDVKMYLLTEVAAMDAFIACWDTKMHYDFARPHALVHHYFKDKEITGWSGPDKGIVKMKGQEWRPYSPDNFLCPPFPGYVSGHSTVSGACSEVLRLFTGDDHFGEGVTLMPGILTDMKNMGDSIRLKLTSFTETAELAGISRVLGGYHIQSDNVEGLKLGRKVGDEVWEWYLRKVSE